MFHHQKSLLTLESYSENIFTCLLYILTSKCTSFAGGKMSAFLPYFFGCVSNVAKGIKT